MPSPGDRSAAASDSEQRAQAKGEKIEQEDFCPAAQESA
jgi:hypothetical protein